MNYLHYNHYIPVGIILVQGLLGFSLIFREPCLALAPENQYSMQYDPCHPQTVMLSSLSPRLYKCVFLDQKVKSQDSTLLIVWPQVLISPSVLHKEMEFCACCKARLFYSNAVCYTASLSNRYLPFNCIALTQPALTEHFLSPSALVLMHFWFPMCTDIYPFQCTFLIDSPPLIGSP